MILDKKLSICASSQAVRTLIREVPALILYTPMPVELIWLPPEAAEIPSALQEIESGGVTLLVQPVGINSGKIVQIRSTDPNQFLKPEYQPGRVISFTPELNLHDDR